MRSFQVMRYRRRSTLTHHDIPQPIRSSLSLQVLSSRRDSLTSSIQERNEDVRPSHDNNLLFKHRRNTLLPNVDLTSRRLSIQQQDLIDAAKSHRTSLRNFYIFFLFLFLFLLMSLVYSFIRMIKNPN